MSLFVKRTTRRYFGALLPSELEHVSVLHTATTHYLFFAWVTRRLRA
jgi:hypothetical protein